MRFRIRHVQISQIYCSWTSFLCFRFSLFFRQNALRKSSFRFRRTFQQLVQFFGFFFQINCCGVDTHSFQHNLVRKLFFLLSRPIVTSLSFSRTTFLIDLATGRVMPRSSFLIGLVTGRIVRTTFLSIIKPTFHSSQTTHFFFQFRCLLLNFNSTVALTPVNNAPLDDANRTYI